MYGDVNDDDRPDDPEVAAAVERLRSRDGAAAEAAMAAVVNASDTVKLAQA